MFSEEEFNKMNEESKRLDNEFISLPPVEVLSAMASFQIVYHPAIGKKLYEELQKVSFLLEDILYHLEATQNLSESPDNDDFSLENTSI